MSVFHLPNIYTSNMLFYLDAANPKSCFQTLTCTYNWFVTDGSNPTTKATFDAFFATASQGTGQHIGNIDWPTVGVRPSYITPSVSFAWEVQGYLYIPKSGVYEFATQSDDGDEFQLNNAIITNHYGPRGISYDYSSPLSLTEGWISFQYRMEQGGGGAAATLSWKQPGDTLFSIIPATYFAGNALFDLTGNGHHGVLGANPSYTSTNSGGILFDGTTVGQNITIPYSTSFDFSLAQTIFMFLKPSSDATSARRNPYNQQYTGPGTITHETNSKFSYYFGDGTAYTEVDSNFTVAPTELACISVTRDQASNTVNWYKNGLLTNTGVAGGYATTANGTTDITIGNGYTTNFSGEIYQVLIYNRALSSAEIYQNFVALRGRYGL